MDIPILPTHPAELELAVTTEHATEEMSVGLARLERMVHTCIHRSSRCCLNTSDIREYLL